ncbi:Hsp20 family protein (plasmid) [Rhizobium sp. CB3060]|uniref:Hsp20 family protein n=1 Tax=Rhizobium sp. CB3060 TaxID=3138255 RepID=UPI0021A78C48|nr:Hsp20 family protein [Rhizobium tropici]UWU25571.1 Hsp20 family protein [Rhizobium tropici]
MLLEDGVLTLRGKPSPKPKTRIAGQRALLRTLRTAAGFGSPGDESKVAATFKNGLLAVMLPKTEKEQANVKRIAIDNTE